MYSSRFKISVLGKNSLKIVVLLVSKYDVFPASSLSWALYYHAFSSLNTCQSFQTVSISPILTANTAEKRLPMRWHIQTTQFE